MKIEKNNLLYVALTRASQFLFISSADSNQNKDSWMNMILNFNQEIKNFIQVCPKEMIDKLENPITLKSKEKKVS